MNAIPRLAALAMPALVLALAGCQAEKKPANAKGTVAGEILPGSASDAMLPYDTVRSQPPLAPQTESASAPDDPREPRAARSGSASDRADDTAADSTPAAPAPTIAAESVE